MVFKATILHCKAILGWGQSEQIRWILLWIMPLAQDRSLDLLASSPARYHCTTLPLTTDASLKGKMPLNSWILYSTFLYALVLWSTGMYLCIYVNSIWKCRFKIILYSSTYNQNVQDVCIHSIVTYFIDYLYVCVNIFRRFPFNKCFLALCTWCWKNWNKWLGERYDWTRLRVHYDYGLEFFNVTPLVTVSSSVPRELFIQCLYSFKTGVG